jgi:hypothetical protein
MSSPRALHLSASDGKPSKLDRVFNTRKHGYSRLIHISAGKINDTADPVAYARQTATAECAIARAHGFGIQHRDLNHD